MLCVSVPDHLIVRGMRAAPPRIPACRSIREALDHPIDSAALGTIARQKRSQRDHAQAVIVVSDNTRPVPYYGEGGLLMPIIDTLRQAGFADEYITILIGTGSHRNMQPDEQESMLGLKAYGLEGITVINHEYDVEESLESLGRTRRGSHVFINKRYYHADLKIVTGLVESHFMAGASGGRKGICPAIVGRETLGVFHGAELLDSEKAVDLEIDGNPVHEEALEMAGMAGCDFLVNVTLDADGQLTGVFAGDLEAAHREAVRKIRDYVVVDVDRRYDIVLIPAGYVGVNHYQACKAAVVAARAVKRGGSIIIVAKNTDPDPIGGEGYKHALRLLNRHGKTIFLEKIRAFDWLFVQEQWQVQMWCKVFTRLGEADHLYYCAVEIPLDDYRYVPGIPGLSLLSARERRIVHKERMMERMVAYAVDAAVKQSGIEKPSILFLRDGPYGIPVVE